MMNYVVGDKSKAICEKDGVVHTTFEVRDLPFDDGSGIVRDILVSVCDECGEVVAIPSQSTPEIKSQRDEM